MARKLIGLSVAVALAALLAGTGSARNAPSTSRPSAANQPAPAAPAAPAPATPQAPPAAAAQPQNAPAISGPAVVIYRGTETQPKPASDEKGWNALIIPALWPVASIILAIIILTNANLASAARQLMARITKVSGPGGIEVDLTPEAAKEIRASIGETLGELIGKADEEYARAVLVARIWEGLGRIMYSELPAALRARGVAIERPQARGTIHVPDIVYKEYLYQLTRYYVTTEYATAVQGAPGRRFSMRYGIIGRAWRLQESLATGNALAAPAQMAPAQVGAVAPQAAQQQGQRFSEDTRKLIVDWGMFADEARPGAHGHPAYLCVVLRSDAGVEGLLYIESPTADAFGADANQQALGVAATLEARCTALANALGEQMKNLRESGPFLQVSQ